jgi:hypothetical protein
MSTESRIERARSTGLSNWGLRLLAVLSLALVVSLAWMWVEAFYSNVQVNYRLSWYTNDQPIPVIDTIRGAEPVVGHHYFGDFQVPWSYARDLRHGISPYLRPSPGQYPPFTQALFLPFSTLPVQTALWLFLVLTAGALLVPLWLLLAPVQRELRIIFLLPAAVVTTGFVASLDRGNSAGLTVAFLAWALWAWRKERWFWCGVFLVGAIALKAHPAALLIVPLALRRYKFAIAVAAGGALGNLVFLSFYPGGYITNLRAVWPSLSAKGGDQIYMLYSWSLFSVAPKTWGLLFGPQHVMGVLNAGAVAHWFPSVLYVVGLFVVIRRGRVPQWCWGPLALAMTQLVVPLSGAYNATWAAVGAVWFARGTLVNTGRDEPPDDDRSFVLLRILLLVALTVTLTPSAFTIAGRDGFPNVLHASHALPRLDILLTMYLSPILLAVTMAEAVVFTCHPKRRARVAAASTRDESADVVSGLSR